jgi:hypothetical protein
MSKAKDREADISFGLAELERRFQSLGTLGVSHFKYS